MKHKVLDLFAGIGGFSLGLEATGGFETTAFCELDKKAQLVLKKHWPDVPIYEDIKELTYERLQADGNVPSVITGGFPCQDISCAGKAKGILAERSGLWSEMFRLIRDVRPTWAIIENVSALRSKGLTLVLQNLCEIGYMCEWHCIPASAVGAPHQRDRIWIISYPNSNSQHERTRKESQQPTRDTAGKCVGNFCEDVADSDSKRLQGHSEELGGSCEVRTQETPRLLSGCPRADFWAVEPNVGRVAHGIPKRVDRLKQLGNSVVPQIPYLLGCAILSTETLDAKEDTNGNS